MTITQFNERWFVLGDITKSTRFFHVLDETTNNITPGNQLLFKVTHKLNSAIENIYGKIERLKPETALLGNTMGDGFLVVGLAGHGKYHIQYEFADTLRMCYRVKSEADKILRKTKKRVSEMIKAKTSRDFCLPNLELKLCIHFGYVLTSVGFNRYIGDCINRCARIISSAFKDRPTDSLILTDTYFKLLPSDIKKYIQCNGLFEQVELQNYFVKHEKNQVTIWRIRFKDKPFWNKVRYYYNHYDPSENIRMLQEPLYKKRNPKRKNLDWSS